MAFSNSNDNEEGLMSEINMTPFVDVMLVLLIIFIVTLPVIQHSVKIELPKASSKANDAAKSPQPEVNLRADKSVIYEKVAQVLAASKRAGLTNIGFITEPK